jgi:hypothetical protein
MHIYKHAQLHIINIIIHLLLVDHLSQPHSLIHGHGTYLLLLLLLLLLNIWSKKWLVLRRVQVMLSHIQCCPLPLGSQ